MAYQTLPNTFVSGSTIYSTAVSANFVSVLQGYTTGNYDGWFEELKTKSTLDVASGLASISTAGNISGQNLAAAGSATVGGAAAVTGDLSVGGDVYTVQWTNVSAATAAAAGWDTVDVVTSYRYRRVGNLIFVNLNLTGTSTATAKSVQLPVTAGANQPVAWWPARVVNDGSAQAAPGFLNLSAADSRHVDILTNGAGASFTSANGAAVHASFFYEVD